MYSLNDFDFSLPDDLIAQTPAAQRDGSRLLQVGSDGTLVDAHFPDVLALLRPGDALVRNNTRVIPARLIGRKATGGRCEILVERVLSEHEFLAQIKASHKPKVGDAVYFDQHTLEVLRYEPPFVVMQSNQPVLQLLEQVGSMPLPPYITRPAQATDQERYQTVYAKEAGAVAAPTAGLHWTESLLDQAQARGVELIDITLHVGAGTFSPVRVDDLSQHQMHAEWFEISEAAAEAINQTRARAGKIVSVGTTTLRALESAAQATGQVQAGATQTRIFITPGFSFKVVDALITNFHLPKSTLMMLVSAFGGYEVLRNAYAHAVAAQYRFFSYGDAMWLERAA
jgi:S-adenosylmethionine:tRNA ribosyltransferase-isomerase